MWEVAVGPTKEGVLSLDLNEHNDHLCTKSVNSGVGVHEEEVCRVELKSPATINTFLKGALQIS